jgi:hypothetical protein
VHIVGKFTQAAMDAVFLEVVPHCEGLGETCYVLVVRVGDSIFGSISSSDLQLARLTWQFDGRRLPVSSAPLKKRRKAGQLVTF